MRVVMRRANAPATSLLKGVEGLRDWVGKVGFDKAVEVLAKRTNPDTSEPYGEEAAKKIIGKLKGMANRAGTLAPEHSYDPAVREAAKAHTAMPVCPSCKKKVTKMRLIGEPVGYCDTCDRNVPFPEPALKAWSWRDLLKSGGEGARGGHVIGHTKSGKPVYASRSEAEWKEHHAGFTARDHAQAMEIHSAEREKAGDRETWGMHSRNAMLHAAAVVRAGWGTCRRDRRSRLGASS